MASHPVEKIVLFLDLLKAFDRIVRELVVGWIVDPEVHPYDYLVVCTCVINLPNGSCSTIPDTDVSLSSEEPRNGSFTPTIHPIVVLGSTTKT